MVEDLKPEPSGRSSPRLTRRALTAIGLSILALGGAFAWRLVSATRRGDPWGRQIRLISVDRTFPERGRFPGDPYAGAQVCAECHPGESAIHARSGHARTLRAASRRLLARRLDGRTAKDPERPDITWRYALKDGQLVAARDSAGAIEEFVLEYAFGSGHHATTFVTMNEPTTPSAFEHRLTHYEQADRMGISPGQEIGSHLPGTTSTGRQLPPRNTRKCFACHTTHVPARGQEMDLVNMLPNVSCERCHGPGREHVAAARRGALAGEPALAMPLGAGRWDAESLLLACGECHRHPSRARPDQLRPDDPQLARFQPVGVSQSACYKMSGGNFHCVTCHDPHARPSSDRVAYDSICLQCHGGATPSLASSVVATACPKSPTKDCVSCHMPRVDSGQSVLFTDHWIRVRREPDPQSSSGPTSGQVPLDLDGH